MSKQPEKKTCVGCKHLFYYNDGGVDCDYSKGVVETCLHSDNRYLYDKEDVTKSILSNNTK